MYWYSTDRAAMLMAKQDIASGCKTHTARVVRNKPSYQKQNLVISDDMK